MAKTVKMTLASFKDKLESGGYSQRGFASRAVNKTREMSESDKKAALKLVDTYFGTDKPSKAKASTKEWPARGAELTPSVTTGAPLSSADAVLPAVNDRLHTYAEAIKCYTQASNSLQAMSSDKVSIEEGMRAGAKSLTSLMKSMHETCVEPLEVARERA